MSELAQALIADSYATAPSHIFEGLTDDLVYRTLPGVPHSIYGELWHIAFWQRITLHWIAGIDVPYPAKASDGFPPESSTELPQEPWGQLCHRFLHGAERRHSRTGCHPPRSIRPLSLPSRSSYPHHDRPRPAHLARRPQRLPLRPHRTAASAAWSMATGLGWLHLVELHKSRTPFYATTQTFSHPDHARSSAEGSKFNPVPNHVRRSTPAALNPSHSLRLH